MPIHLTSSLKRRSVLRDTFYDPRPLVVWWYGGIRKNLRSGSQPLVLVFLRELLDSQRLSDKLIRKWVPLCHFQKTTARRVRSRLHYGLGHRVGSPSRRRRGPSC